MVAPTKHSVRKHSDFSASASKRWLTCPGSVRLSRLAPPSKDNKYSREGTAAHECLEFIMRRYSDRVNATRAAVLKWPVEMVEHALAAGKLIMDLRPSRNARLLIEKRVVLNQVSSRLFGTLDYAWVEDWGALTVIDYKYGAGVAVTPFDEDGEPNTQLMYYAAGLCHENDYDFDRITLAIIQPRVWRDGESPLWAGSVTMKSIRNFEQKIKEGVAAANRNDAPLKAGEHCRWCPASATCPENSRTALKEADVVFDFDTGVSATPEPFALTPANLAKILPACDQLEMWIDAVRKRALHIAESGRSIPGYKLVAKRAQRIWTGHAQQNAAELFGEAIYDTPEPRFISPAQIEKRFGSKGKAFAKEHSASVVSSGYSLVSDRDRRSQVTPDSPFDIEV